MFTVNKHGSICMYIIFEKLLNLNQIYFNIIHQMATIQKSKIFYCTNYQEK